MWYVALSAVLLWTLARAQRQAEGPRRDVRHGTMSREAGPAHEIPAFPAITLPPADLHEQGSAFAAAARSPRAAVPPWLSPDAFPAAPAVDTFGFARRRRLVTCSRDALIERCGSKEGAALVWTPETPRLVPPQEIPFLAEALRSHDLINARQNQKDAWGPLLLWGTALFSANTAWPLFVALMASDGLLPMWEAARAARRAVGTAAVPPARGAVDTSARFRAWLGRQPYDRLVVAMVSLCTIAGVLQLILGLERSIAAAALVKPAVRNGEYWRLLTGPMLHGTWWHLLGNMAALIVLAAIVRALAAAGSVAVVLLLAVLGGSLASLWVAPAGTSVGLSGGIMGLLGFALAVVSRRRHHLPRELLPALLKAALCTAGVGAIAHQFIDNAAHAGGFATGLLLGVLLVRHGDDAALMGPRPMRLAGRLAGLVLLAAALGACWVLMRGL
jgi:membrane associated rhomboid family serine protease